MGFEQLDLQRVFRELEAFDVRHFNRATKGFKKLLAKEKTIRLFVDGTPGMGHQISSIRVLRTLLGSSKGPYRGFEFKGTVEICYRQWGDAIIPVADKIVALLPEVNWDNEYDERGDLICPVGELYGQKLRLLAYPPQVKSEFAEGECLFGFTGGADSRDAQDDEGGLGEGLGVHYFLRLQPMGWYSPEQVQRMGGVGPDLCVIDVHDLRRSPHLGNEDFRWRAFRIPKPEMTDTDWQRYTDVENVVDSDVEETKNKAGLLQWLSRDEQLASFDICVIDGFHTYDPVIVAPSTDQVLDSLLNLLVAICVAQDRRTPRKPVIVINLDELRFEDDRSRSDSYPSFEYLRRVLDGKHTRVEASWAAQNLDKYRKITELTRIAAIRGKFFKDCVKMRSDGIPERLGFEQDFDLQDFQVKCGSMKNDRVLFLQVGKVPPDIYAYMLSRSTFPTVFAQSPLSEDTANLALSIGNSYFNMLQSDQNYPNLPPSRNPCREGNAFKLAAALIRHPLHKWGQRQVSSRSSRRIVVPLLLGGFITRYENMDDGSLAGYLKEVSDYYSKVRNDKLRMGFNYLGFVYAGRLEPETRMTNRLGAESNELDGIFDSINTQLDESKTDQLHDKKVNLLAPDVLGGLEANSSFCRELLGDETNFLVRVATLEKTPPEGDEGETETVELSGTTDFFVDNMRADITFSLLEGHIRVLAKYTSSDDRWTPDALPWISLSDPFLEFDVVEGGLPMVGALGGTVTLGGQPVTLSIALPVTEGLWLLRATTESANIGLAQVYDFFAGVNLLSVVPREIAGLGGLHLTGIEGVYDSESNHLDYLMAEAETASEFPLFGNVKLSKLGLQLVVQSPTSSPSLSGTIRGEFKIGKKDGEKEPALVSVSAGAPELRFSGALTSGEIQFVDLLGEFCSGVEPPAALSLAPTITGFRFSYDQPAEEWEIGCDLSMTEPWGLQFGGTRIVQLESLGFLATDHSASLYGNVSILPDAQDVDLQLLLSAGYENKAWRFAAQQTGGRLPLGKLAEACLGWHDAPPIDITGLGLEFSPTNKSYSFTARTAEDLPIKFLGLRVGASVRLASDGEQSRSGEIKAQVNWRSITLDVTYAFENEKSSWKITCEGLGTAEYQNDVARIKLENLTLGDLVSKFVGWATGRQFGLTQPWNVLDKINLDGLELSFNFATKEVSVTRPNLNLNLGFLQIDDLTLTYSKEKEGDKGQVDISLTGNFPWITDGPSDELKWDAADPDSAPDPPGGFLDLRLLALGQHVSIAGSQDFGSINDAIVAMRELPAPSDDGVPVGLEPVKGRPYFNADSSWLIAADFGLLHDDNSKSGHAVQMSLVLSDPVLYGIRVALDGDAAKILAGLEFEIMYRRISDTIGVYQTEVTLPDAMRHLNLGAYAVTLPVFALQVYTNGDFMVDFGFPRNCDFARSFTIEGIIPPGIPVIGSGGFYFSKLSAETADQLPAVTAQGRFNPVNVFGFGLQVGFGRSVNKGPLKANFSLTILGILEGVIAKWNPQRRLPHGAKDQLQGAYYFKLNGTVGIIGKLHGALDFSVIKANVFVEVKVIAQICLESYQDIPITVLAAVDIKVSLRLHVGIFTIKINLSFSAQIKETFVIHNPEAKALPPWQQDPRDRLLEAPAWNNLTVARRGYRDSNPVTFNWDNYAVAPIDLTGYLVPMLTVRYDDGQPKDACYVAMLLLETVAESDAPDDTSLTSFQKLCEEALRWVIAAARAPIDPSTLDRIPVSKDDLDAIIRALGDPQNPMPITAANAATFMQNCFKLDLSVPPNKAADTEPDERNMAFFPMVPELRLQVPSVEGVDYAFDQFTTLSDRYVSDLRARFDSLAEQVEEELESQAALENAASWKNKTESMASFCFADYFLLLARQMAQAARDAIRNFQYPITPGESILEIVGKVNGWSPKDTPGPQDYRELFRANADHPLNAGKPLNFDILTYQVAAGDTLAGIVEKYSPPTGTGFTAAELAEYNARSHVSTLMVGKEIKLGEDHSYIVQSGDTLQAIADQLSNGTVAKLVDAEIVDDNQKLTFASLPGLLQPHAILRLPLLVHETQEHDTLSDIATRYHIKVEQLTQQENGPMDALGGESAQQNETPHRNATSAWETNLGIRDLFAVGEGDLRYLRITHREQFTVESVLDQIRRSNGTTQLSGMASRYMLHGLRLPTKGITPGHHDTELRDNMGLYELTGQQFPLPSDASDGFSFTLSKPDENKWIRFAGDLAQTQLPFLVGADEAERIQTVRHAAESGIAPVLTQLGALDAATATQATFPLRSMMRWQCGAAGDIKLSHGAAPETHDELRIWWLPEDIFAFGNAADARPAAPRLAVRLASYNDAKSETTTEASKAFEYATLVDFTIRKLAPASPSATPHGTYELIGAGDRSINRLERLLRAGATPRSGTILYPDRSTSERSAAEVQHGLALESSGGSGIPFISQVNLTTYTKPGLESAPAKTGASIAWLDFAKRLWRCSITRSGGFYFSYAEGKDSVLPDRIFDDRGEARIWVLLRYAEPEVVSEPKAEPEPKTEPEMRPFDYMNCVITGDAFGVTEESATAVFLEAAPISKPAVQVGQGDSLQTIADRHFMSAIDVALENPGVRLVTGYPINVTGATYMFTDAAPSPRLVDIADYFNTSVEAIREANPERVPWPEQLSTGDAIRLPTLRTTVGRQIVIGGKVLGERYTIAEIAEYHGCSVADIAAANAAAVGLIKTEIDAKPQTLSLSGGPSVRTANSAQGAIAIGATRDLKEQTSEDIAESNAEQYLQQMFSMLRYQVRRNLNFHQTEEGLPMGPVQPSGPGKEQVNRSYYRANIPYRRLAGPDTKAPENPYAHIGDLLQVDYGWQDVFGNDGPKPQTPPNNGPVLLRYTDPLIGLNAWPGVESSFHLTQDSATPELVVAMRFDTSRYNRADDKLQKLSAHQDDNGPAGDRNAQLDLRVFTRLCHQIEEVRGEHQQARFSLETSLLAQQSVDFSVEQSNDLQVWLREIRDYLKGRAEYSARDGIEPFEAGKLTIRFPLDGKDQSRLNPAQIFPLSVVLRMRRPETAIHPTLRDNRDIFDVRSTINPSVFQSSITQKRQTLDGLRSFSAMFEASLEQTEPGVSFKIATGVPRESLNDAGSRTTLWVVRLGPGAGNGISYKVLNPDRPAIFAPRPLATKPVTMSGQDYDMDMLCREFTQAVDELLSPEFAVPARALEPDRLEPLLDAKEKLAEALSHLVEPVFQDDVDRVTTQEQNAARELLRQRLLVRLENLYDSAAIVQFNAQVGSSFSGHLAPRLYGIPEPKSSEGRTHVSFGSAKLSLANTSNPSLVTFVAEIADQTTELNESYLPLDLEFDVTHIEHEIDEGIEEYQPSSWLSFVIPPAALKQDLGSFHLPRMLRAGPTPPVVQHSAVTANGKVSRASLPSLLNWNYQLCYAQDYHEPQDKTKFEVSFGSSGARLGDGPPNPLFQALATFTAEYPKRLELLRDAIADSKEEAKRFDQITELINIVKTAAETALIDQADSKPAVFKHSGQLYEFTIEEKAIDRPHSDQSILYLGIIGNPADRAGEPSVKIEGCVAESEKHEGSDVDFGFVFRREGGTDTPTYLSAKDGREIRERTVKIPGLNILARQNAALSAWVVRNEGTIDPVRETNPQFVYESPRSEPGFQVRPMITVEDEIRIHEVDPADRRSLAEHLGNFLSELFAESSATQCTLQLECAYSYHQDEGSKLPAIPVPVFFRPPSPFQLPTTDGPQTIPAAVENLATGISDWAKQMQPSRSQAALRLDMTIFTSDGGEPKPLLQLRNVVLPVTSTETLDK